MPCGTVCWKWVPVLFWGCKQALRHSRFAYGDWTMLLSLSLSLSLSLITIVIFGNASGYDFSSSSSSPNVHALR
jgi:hypothetical protein